LVNTDEPVLGLSTAERRVREIQTKLHRWASDDPHRRFDDLYNLVCDPAFVLVAWDRVRHNKGARSAGVDGRSAYAIEAEIGVEVFCDRLRQRLKTRTFRPVAVRERMIPKANGKKRRLGIATVTSYCPPAVVCGDLGCGCWAVLIGWFVRGRTTSGCLMALTFLNCWVWFIAWRGVGCAVLRG
jgi:hypothetical protein